MRLKFCIKQKMPWVAQYGIKTLLHDITKITSVDNIQVSCDGVRERGEIYFINVVNSELMTVMQWMWRRILTLMVRVLGEKTSEAGRGE